MKKSAPALAPILLVISVLGSAAEGQVSPQGMSTIQGRLHQAKVLFDRLPEARPQALSAGAQNLSDRRVSFSIQRSSLQICRRNRAYSQSRARNQQLNCPKHRPASPHLEVWFQFPIPATTLRSPSSLALAKARLRPRGVGAMLWSVLTTPGAAPRAFFLVQADSVPVESLFLPTRGVTLRT